MKWTNSPFYSACPPLLTIASDVACIQQPNSHTAGNSLKKSCSNFCKLASNLPQIYIFFHLDDKLTLFDPIPSPCLSWKEISLRWNLISFRDIFGCRLIVIVNFKSLVSDEQNILGTTSCWVEDNFVNLLLSHRHHQICLGNC